MVFTSPVHPLERGQVRLYLLCARLAHLEVAPDTPDTRHLAGGHLSRVPLGRRVPLAVQLGGRLGYGQGRGECGCGLR